MTAKKQATKAAATAPPPKTTDDLAERIKKLPDGTKEAAAYAELGQHFDRPEFRNVWIPLRGGKPDAAEKPGQPEAAE